MAKYCKDINTNINTTTNNNVLSPNYAGHFTYADF